MNFFNIIFIPQETLEYVVAGIMVLLILSVVLHIRTEIRLRRILRGKGAKDLEDSFVGFDRDIKEILNTQSEIETYLRTAEKRIRRSMQGVHTVRFNPFKGTGVGGNQSFATALVNEKGDGVVISSMHSRDRTSIFSKPIIDFKSEYELTKEEKEAITKAKPL